MCATARGVGDSTAASALQSHVSAFWSRVSAFSVSFCWKEVDVAPAVLRPKVARPPWLSPRVFRTEAAVTITGMSPASEQRHAALAETMSGSH
ncbi:MAG: hypothetical protein GEU86_17495 [Actinophytocola sp.]|nr:hypothetical protein [Actinophytocola sp.]